MLRLWVFINALALSAPPGLALAQNAVATDEAKAEVFGKEDEEDGWKLSGKLGASFSLNHNDSVVGTEDGLTLQLGGVLGVTAQLTAGQHGWKTTLDLQETQTRTPQLERFVKSLDQLDLRTMYTYRFVEPTWLGLFARATLNTQVFEGEFVANTDDVEIRRIGLEDSTDALSLDTTQAYFDGQRELRLNAGESALLTGFFEPLNLRQSAGAFAEPVKQTEINVTFEVGAAAQEVIARNGDIQVASFDVTEGDGSRRVVVVRPLEDFVFELGVETELDIRGKLLTEILSYYITLNAFFPPFSSSDVDRDFADTINLRFKAGASAKLNEWLNAEYVLTVLRIPATTTDLQVQNGLLLSVSFDLI